ncbi:MAG: STAS domain-containing protein [Nitrospirales bacterium]
MVIDTVDQANGTIVLSLRGRYDFQSRHAYQSALDQAFQATPKLVILDFSHVTYIDSAGLGLLALSHKKFFEHAMCLSIAGPRKLVKQILNLANMGEIFPICDSVTAATQATASRQ